MGLSDDGIAYLTTASPTEVIYLTQESAKKYGIAYENACLQRATSNCCCKGC